MKAGAAGGIEAVVMVIDAHIYSVDACYAGCWALSKMININTLLQKYMCEKGGLESLLTVLMICDDNEDLLCSCCGAIGTLLSSPEIHSKYCTSDVIRIVEECYEKHKDSEQIKQFLLSLKREEDPRVRDADARGMCTKEAFPKCSKDCVCDDGYYCPKCCVQQKAFRCLTCDNCKTEIYCEVCWQRDHQGHKGEEFFCPVRCATGHKFSFFISKKKLFLLAKHIIQIIVLFIIVVALNKFFNN